MRVSIITFYVFFALLLTINITAAWAPDQEFVYIVGPAGWVPMTVLLGPFGRLGALVGSLGRLTSDFGLPLPNWLPLGCP